MFWLSLILIVILALIFVGLLVGLTFSLMFIFPIVRGAVYVPSKDDAIETMVKLAKIKPGMRTADLGSGDGRVVQAFAAKKAQADGYEINPWLVWKSNRRLKQAGLQKQSHIYRSSYWKYDLSDYDVITVYGITYIMDSLGKKLRQELKPGSLVLSNYYKFPNWKPIKQENGIRVYKV